MEQSGVMVNSWRDPGAAWWAKAERARKHIQDIEAMVVAFDPATAYEVLRDPSDPGETALRLRVVRSVPTEMLTTIGDALHNMRSCLDSVAYELAQRYAGAMTEKEQRAIQFPICVDREEFDDFVDDKRRARLFGEQERNALRCAQPFALAEEAASLGVTPATTPDVEYRINQLARLSRVNNLDKHRYLPLLAWYVDFLYATEMVPYCRVSIRQGVHFEDGDLIGRVIFDEGQGDPSSKLTLRMRQTFADDPAYASDFLAALTDWHRYLTAWIVPRIFVVADGNPPPMGFID